MKKNFKNKCSPLFCYMSGSNLPMQEKEVLALIQLLDDSDQEVLAHVQSALLAIGTHALPQLEEAWENTINTTMQQRLEDLIRKIQWEYIADRLRKWKNDGATDLLEGALLINRYQYPDLNEDRITKELERIKKDIWLEIHDDMTAIEKIRVVNHVLFDVHGFKGNKLNFHAPPNNFLSSILDTKKSNPVGLGVLYMLTCQALDIPVYGVNLPETFVLAYREAAQSTNLLSLQMEEKILFYINPFAKGAIFGKGEIEVYLQQIKVANRSEFFEVCSNLDIVIRLINNLIYTYEGMGYAYKVGELKAFRQLLTQE